ncbi:uncharacterized protein LOC112566165 [Pomacea canaliculata]|uniref:uncharacterized protein LOC112566165 n=1 Tax=Pomacea canaliculata TaxID=400727 RepID=UPI000D73BDE8|nr:uncharacterized protein LOC112566165 [Pomacea canaliculata]
MAYTLGVVYGLRATSDIISMIIAVDRCLCVLLPLRVTHLIRTRTMAAMMAASFFFLQLCYIVLPLRFTVARVYINSTGIFDWKIMPTEIGVKYANILDSVSSAFLSISLPVITFVIVSLATAMTVMKLMSATRWREQTSSATSGSRDRQAGATKMLVLVSCLYIITMAPSVACIVTRFIIRDFSPYGRYYYGYMSVTMITEKMSWINNAVNFFVYLAQSSRFRQNLIKGVFCGQKTKSPVYPTRSLTTALSSKQ